MVRRGTRGIADVMLNIKKMLQDKASNDNIIDYIKVSIENYFYRKLGFFWRIKVVY